MGDDFERHVVGMVEALREAMARRRASQPGTDEPKDAWDDIAKALCTYVGSFDGPMFGEVIVERLSDEWQPISTAPERVELLVRGGRSVFGVEQRGTSVAIIEDRADLYRPDGTLKPMSPTMWRLCPPPPQVVPTPSSTEGA